MPTIDLRLDQDGCWPDIGAKRQAGLLRISEAPIGIALLTEGMQSGRPSVSFRIDLPDGQLVLVQTSFRALYVALQAMEAKIKTKASPYHEGDRHLIDG
jgi:hypothetical protein